MTTMLDLLSSYLDAREVQHCRIDGSISWQERQEAMKQFNTEEECKVGARGLLNGCLFDNAGTR